MGKSGYIPSAYVDHNPLPDTNGEDDDDSAASASAAAAAATAGGEEGSASSSSIAAAEREKENLNVAHTPSAPPPPPPVDTSQELTSEELRDLNSMREIVAKKLVAGAAGGMPDIAKALKLKQAKV